MTYLQDRNLIGLFLQDSYSPPRAFLQIPTDGIIVHYWTKFGDMQNNQGQGKCYQPNRMPMLITLTETLIIQDYQKNRI